MPRTEASSSAEKSYTKTRSIVQSNHKVRSEEVVSDIKIVLDKFLSSIRAKIEKSRKIFGQNSIVFDAHNSFQRYTLAVIFLITYRRENDIDFDAESDVWVDRMERGANNISNPIVALAIMFPFIRPLCRFLVQFHDVGRLQVEIIDYIIEATDINRIAREQHAKFQRRLNDGLK